MGADKRCIKSRTARPKTGTVRGRITIAMAVFAGLAFPGSALATTGGPVISEFETGLTAGVGLWGIAPGPDGNLWFTEETHNAVGRITPGAVITEFTAGFPTGSPKGIVTGPDGNLWVAMAGGDGAIARVTKTGEVTEYPVLTAGDPEDITVGPDNNLWYVDSAANLIGRVTPEGSITEFTDGLSDSAAPTGIAKGPDGALWFTEPGAGRIGRVTTAGVITEFSSGISGSSEPTDIVKGPDGNLWFTMAGANGSIGRITPQGVFTEFSDGLSLLSSPREIAAGPDGNLWFTESAIPGRIGRITTSGDITEFSTGLLSILSPWGIAAGPDGNMWFTGNNIPGKIGRITLPPLVRDMAPDQVGTTSVRLRGKLRPNSQATHYHFEYGPTADYGSKTASTYAGSGYDLLTVTGGVEGLAPGTKYHFRLVASNDAGVTEGPDRIFETLAPLAGPSTPPEQPKAEPDFGKTVVVEPEGSVRFKNAQGAWQALSSDAELPVGAVLDTRRGRVALSSRGCRGGMQTGRFGGGIFSVRQPRSGCGRVDLYLRGGSFKSCPRLSARRHRAGRTASASRSRRVRKLWGRDHGGRFRSHGRHSHATVRGTRWLTVDRCDGTLTRVTGGSVAVRDFARHRTVVVRAGHSYVAKSRKALRRQRLARRHHRR
jgi:virginiamycin B lyase